MIVNDQKQIEKMKTVVLDKKNQIESKMKRIQEKLLNAQFKNKNILERYHSLKGYFEDKLDRTVRGIVKQKYYDYKITYVQEVETGANVGMPTYMVHIEGDNDFKIVKVCDGAMDIYEEFGRQK